jgi:two-component system CheB/CheR fusion protein
MIRRNVELETRLIDDLLDVTRISNGKLVLNPETVDVHTLVAQTLEVCERDLHEKGIRVTVDARAAAHHAVADPARLQQVLWNILKNAIKFTPPGGHVAVRTANPAGAARVRVEVSDDGAGIDPDVLPNIFNAFEQGGRTVTSRYGGLGLGLAIAKTLVELHRGRLTAASRGRGHGATFTVDLPAVPPPPPVGAPHAASGMAGEGARTSRLRILLVEDHEDTARVMTRLLAQVGYDVETARGIAAARALVSNRPFDLVISDLGLPDGSGNDLMRELRDRHGLKGIALTGWGMEEDVRGAHEAGFARHLTKPVNFQALRAAIRDVTDPAPPPPPVP